MKENPHSTENWHVYYDDRGTLIEPHTNREIPLGTKQVCEYIERMNTPIIRENMQDPRLKNNQLIRNCYYSYDNKGPHNRYNSLLFIEKEGFFPLLFASKIAEKYDIAIMSDKGLSTTSGRDILDNMDKEVKIFCLHDFDYAGFKIYATLFTDTERYQFKNPPEVIDLGIRLEDIKQCNLDHEPQVLKSDPKKNLKKYRATEEEIEFIRGEEKRVIRKGKDAYEYHGNRVELNEFGNDDFIEWLEEKLAIHCKKVVPVDNTIIEDGYKQVFDNDLRSVLHQKIDSFIDNSNVDIPTDLKKIIRFKLEDCPELSWDDAIGEIYKENIDDEQIKQKAEKIIQEFIKNRKDNTH